jgi:chitodextrinase
MIRRRSRLGRGASMSPGERFWGASLSRRRRASAALALVAGLLLTGGAPSIAEHSSTGGLASPAAVGRGVESPLEHSVATLLHGSARIATQPSEVWTALPNEGTGPTPKGELAGSLAYDAAAQEYVYFGGCASVCPTNITWTFANDSWRNVTNDGPSPPARYYASMSYDANAGGVLLFGGVNAASNDLGDTWLFRGGVWAEVNRTGPSPRGASVMAFDPAASVNATVLFGGCNVAEPPVCSNDTWAWTPASGWSPLPVARSPSARGFAYGSYDPALGSLVVFGGVGPCAATDCDFSDTWQLANGSWVPMAVEGAAPSARYSGGAAYDPYGGGLLVYGGYNLTEDSTDADSWLLVGSQWEPVSLASTPGERGDPALASGGPGAPPLLYGGGEDDAPSMPTDTFVFVEPLSVSVTGAAPVTDLGAQDGFNVTAVGGTPPYSVDAAWGSERADAHGPGPMFSVVAAFGLGAQSISVGLTDAFGFNASGNLSFDVVPAPSVGIVVAQNVTDVGLAVGFLAVEHASGVAPLDLNWSFGDGARASGTIVGHNYSVPGRYDVNLTGTDAIGVVARASVSVQVLAEPIATVGVSGSSIVGTPLNFTSNVSGGLSPYSYAWRFDDGSGSSSADPTHAFGSTGNYTVQLWANDSLGASAHASLLVLVSPQNRSSVTVPPSKSSSSAGTPSWVGPALGVVAVAIVVGVVAVVLIRRRPPTRR